MPVSLAREISASVDWYGEPIAFRFRPDRNTGAFSDRVKAAASDREICELLAELVTWIDIVDGDVPILCDGATFHRIIPSPLAMQLFQKIGESSRPDPQKGSS